MTAATDDLAPVIVLADYRADPAMAALEQLDAEGQAMVLAYLMGRAWSVGSMTYAELMGVVEYAAIALSE